MKIHVCYCAPLFICWFSLQEIYATQPPAIRKSTLVEKKVEKEEEALQTAFSVVFYKQNYILPFYYTTSPYSQVYQSNTPENNQIKKTEVSYQLSFKVPMWENMFASRSSLYVAYTQLAFWQAYNHLPFFRETDFEPEIFVTYKMEKPVAGGWSLDLLQAGAVHASNGFGDSQERAWNRLYLEAAASSTHWMISLRPWYVCRNSGYNKYNPDMAKYLGYGEASLSYKFSQHVITISGHSFFEEGGRYKTGVATYTFPLSPHLNGLVRAFSGYGQSLIEYNHYTNGVGVGVAFNPSL